MTSDYAQSRRKSSHSKYNYRWQKYRLSFLRDNPLCVECLAKGKTTVAKIVDHKKPWQTGRTEAEKYRLFWDPSNHQSLCTTHHSRKTATEDGGFGNKRIGSK